MGATRPTPDVPGIAFIVANGTEPYTQAVVAGARAEAARRAVPLAVHEATGSLEQRRLLYSAIVERDRAVVLAPLDYLDAYLLLRTAHDRGVPTFVLDLDPPPATNQAYVWSFLSTDRAGVAAEGARTLVKRLHPRAHKVLVVASTGATDTLLDPAVAELRRLAPQLLVRHLVLAANESVDVTGVDGILATDETAVALLGATHLAGDTPSMPVVGVGASAAEVSMLRRGAVGALLVPQARELGRLAVDYAITAAAHNPELVPRTLRLEPVTLTAQDLGTAREREWAYPS